MCECGECEDVIPFRDIYGNERHYKNHHHEKGNRHHSWNGGFYYRDKYKMIWIPNHPNCDQDGYVFEHRLVMEKHIGRYLRKEEKIHHLDSNPYNNSICNLQILSQSEHFSIHLKKDMSDRKCLQCNSTKTFVNRKGWACWSKFKNGFICNNCDKRMRYWKKKGSIAQ